MARQDNDATAGNDNAGVGSSVRDVSTEDRPLTQREVWEAWKAPDSLEDCVKMFFELVDKVETSSNGVEFKPNRMVINSCRVWDTHKLGKIIPRMKELSK